MAEPGDLNDINLEEEVKSSS